MIHSYMAKIHLNKISWVFVFLLAFISTSCSAEDPTDPFYTEERAKKVTKEYNVLVIGDSFSRDAFSYAPSVIENICPNLAINMKILYLGGKALNYHISYLNNNTFFTLDTYDPFTGKWYTNYNCIIGEDVICERTWDLVILQEGSNTIRSYEKTQSHVTQLRDYIRQRQPFAKIAFMLSPSKPDGSPALGELTSDQAWEMNAATTSSLLDNDEVEHIIPCGTAIQNARRTIIDRYGDFGHLSFDGDHLQEGFPCLIEAYVTAQFFFNLYGLASSISSCTIETSQQWVDSKHIPGKHGSAINGTKEEYNICKQCALSAIEHPFEVQQY